ncbi:MAG: CopD family protein [Halioglobus sp.]|nr:CopD family protein [Halioglobus sp.]
MYGILLLLHILAATIWTGGHIVLSIVVLPRVLRERSAKRLLEFESVYEKIGMPALVIQVITGLMLAYQLLPDVSGWFDMANPVAHVLAAKFVLLGLTVAFAIDARLRVIPVLSADNLNDMAWHIIPVTVFSILFVVAGVSFRTGWLS